MKERTTLAVSITFIDDNAIRRVKELYEQDKYSHAQIYMRGVESIEKELART